MLGEAGGSQGSHVLELQATSAQEANRMQLSAPQHSTQASPLLAAMLSELQPNGSGPTQPQDSPRVASGSEPHSRTGTPCLHSHSPASFRQWAEATWGPALSLQLAKDTSRSDLQAWWSGCK